MLPTGVQQVPTDIVQEWLRAFQSAEALVRRQRGWIVELEAKQEPTVSATQSAGASEGETMRVDDEDGEVPKIMMEVKGGGFISQFLSTFTFHLLGMHPRGVMCSSLDFALFPLFLYY